LFDYILELSGISWNQKNHRDLSYDYSELEELEQIALALDKLQTYIRSQNRQNLFLDSN